MENSKRTFKMAFEPQDWKIEKYFVEIPIPQNLLTIPPGEIPQNKIDFPLCDKFQSGTLSETPLPHTFFGAFDRNFPELKISEFSLPNRIGKKVLIMKPFEVEILANNAIIGNITKTFPISGTSYTEKKTYSYYSYSTTVDLSQIWRDDVDMIRVTFNIHVQESLAKFVRTGSSKVEVKEMETDQICVMRNEMPTFYDSQEFSDVTIRCGNQVAHVHRCILALASPVFRNMFLIEMKEKKDGEVVIEDIDVKILKLMIKWIYSVAIEVIEIQDQLDLFKAAHKYQIVPLKNWCIAQMCAHIAPENALKMYAFGDSYEETKLEDIALQIIKANKSKVFKEGGMDISKEFVLRYPMLMLELALG